MYKFFLKKRITILIHKYNKLHLNNKITPSNDLNFLNPSIFIKFFIIYLRRSDCVFLHLSNYTQIKHMHNYFNFVNGHSFYKNYKNNNESFLSYSKNKLYQELHNYSQNYIQDTNELPINTPRNTLIRSKQTYSKINFWVNFYSFLPYQSLLNEKLTIINFNILSTTTRRVQGVLLKEALQTFSFLQLDRVAAHFTATIYTALMLKDSKALATFIRNLFREVHFKQHPFYFSFVGFLVKDVIHSQLHAFNCLGVSVVFRGKLGIGGNARKRALKYQTGMISSSSKYVKLSRSLDVIRTKTGIVGYTVIVA